MRIVKLVIILLLVLLLGSLLHYTLPRHEVVRIVGVETRLETFGINRFFYANVPGGAGEADSRDVRYVESLTPSGRERIFRNEDTGWGWPPYFKMNSADLQARARDLVSAAESPRWARVSYYGIRSRVLSVYPNAIRIRAVDGPDAAVFPWTRMIAGFALAALAVWIWVLLRRFRVRRVAPFMEGMGERRAAARGRLGRFWHRFRGRG